MADSLMHQKQQEHRLQVQFHLHVKVAVLPMALYKNAKMEIDKQISRQVGRQEEMKRHKKTEQKEVTAMTKGRERRIERENSEIRNQ